MRDTCTTRVAHAQHEHSARTHAHCAPLSSAQWAGLKYSAHCPQHSALSATVLGGQCRPQIYVKIIKHN